MASPNFLWRLCMNEKNELSVRRKRVAIVQTKAVKDRSILVGLRKITNPEDAASVGRYLVEDADREYLVVCCLNSRGEPVSLQVVSIGSTDACYAETKELFKYAILSNAVSIILFHNHPSGDPSPSGDDYIFTKKIIEAGKILGIKVIDHIILGDDNKYFSTMSGGDEGKDYC